MQDISISARSKEELERPLSLYVCSIMIIFRQSHFFSATTTTTTVVTTAQASIAVVSLSTQNLQATCVCVCVFLTSVALVVECSTKASERTDFFLFSLLFFQFFLFSSFFLLLRRLRRRCRLLVSDFFIQPVLSCSIRFSSTSRFDYQCQFYSTLKDNFDC